MMELDDLCLLCGDTGKWSGSPDPCPDCGAYAPLRKNHAKPTKWRQRDHYRSINGDTPTDNRQLRRREEKMRKRANRQTTDNDRY